MSDNRPEFIEFEQRRGLPSRATKERLLEIGARYFRGETYSSGDREIQVQQMQYESKGVLYLWKRMEFIEDIESKLFEIHLEATPEGYVYFPTL